MVNNSMEATRQGRPSTLARWECRRTQRGKGSVDSCVIYARTVIRGTEYTVHRAGISDQHATRNFRERGPDTLQSSVSVFSVGTSDQPPKM